MATMKTDCCAECGAESLAAGWIDCPEGCSARCCSAEHMTLHEARHEAARRAEHVVRRRTLAGATVHGAERPALRCDESTHEVMRVNRAAWRLGTFNRRRWDAEGFAVGTCVACLSDICYPDPTAAEDTQPGVAP